MSSVPASRPRVLSGITASGKLTIGNYIGALSIWAEQQDSYENFFFIADLHALTIPENVKADALRERIQAIVALYLACGLDPDRCVLFQQSRVPAHAILAWIFDCVTPMGWLERMTQYKAKSQATVPSAGLFTYPALMAADILLYQAAFVPVGDDQRQHIEIARDIAQRFNHLFGDIFVLPQAMIRTSGARIMGLDDPEIKMSKSLAETRDDHAIVLLDPPSKIRKTIMRAVTDSGSELQADNMSAGVSNLLTIYESITGCSREESLNRFAGRGYGTLKKAVAEVVIDRVETIQARYREIRADDSYLRKVLAEGAAQANAVAEETLDSAMRLTGLR
jgi:tryptophanyl-tRNA synthetase